MKASIMKTGWTFIIALGGLLLGAGIAQAQLTVQNVQTVDVTPFGFSVVWQASEVSDPRIEIYTDSLGTAEVTSQYEVTLFPLTGNDPTAINDLQQADAREALRAAARAKGLMKVGVHGLDPDSTVYFRVFSDNGIEEVQEPAGDPIPVTTHQENSFISGSSQLLVTVNYPDPSGWIVTAETVETLGRVSAIVGDGAAANAAYLNLSQLFQANNLNWDPTESKTVTLRVMRDSGPDLTEPAVLAFTGTFAVGTLYLLQIDDQPLISVVEPSADLYTVGESILVTWTDDFPGAGATVALYYDDDGAGEDGTQIVGGIAEDQDGAADTHAWDTTGVPDGVYYVYAEVTDTITTDVSYSLATVTIDRNKTDGDADAMSDLWEQFHFDTLANDGTGDADSDGDRDKNEFDEDTDPNVPDVRLAMVPGLNIVSLPIVPDPAINSGQFLQGIGAAALAISRVNTSTGLVETTVLNAGTAEGTIFPMEAETAYFIELAQNHDSVWMGLSVAAGFDLVAGTNAKGFVGIPENYDAYQLLLDVGADSVISSVRRFNRETGRYETASYVGGTPAGPNFPISRGEGYLFYMRNGVTNFVP